MIADAQLRSSEVPPCPKCGVRKTYTSSHSWVCACPIPIPPTVSSDALRAEVEGTEFSK